MAKTVPVKLPPEVHNPTGREPGNVVAMPVPLAEIVTASPASIRIGSVYTPVGPGPWSGSAVRITTGVKTVPLGMLEPAPTWRPVILYAVASKVTVLPDCALVALGKAATPAVPNARATRPLASGR